MRRILSVFVAIFLVQAVLSAQDVNPTVQVTNDYRTRMSEVRKSGVDISVPDTLYDFDYQFDYSVFESPYKGAYEFSPYMVKMDPSVEPYEYRKLLLRAGAGYTLHPELDLVFSPVVKPGFSMNIFGNAKGFYGNYTAGNGSSEPELKYGGYDFSDIAGLEGNVIMKKSRFTFSLGHNGVYSSLDEWSGAVSGASSAYNAGFADLRFKSSGGGDTFFYYDIGARGIYGADAFRNANLGAKESDITADASLGVVLHDKYKFLMDAKVEFQNLQGVKPVAYNMIDLKPHASFLLGPVSLDAGVKVDFFESSVNIYPDVHAELALGKKRAFTIYAGATGGDKLNTYHTLKMSNPRMNSTYGDLACSHTKLDVFAGFRGYASTHFTYDLSAGYVLYSNFMTDCIIPMSGSGTPYREGIGYAEKYEKIFATAKLAWKSERFDADAEVDFNGLGLVTSSSELCAPPLLEGKVRLRYNFSRRLFISVGAAGETARTVLNSSFPDFPGFVDLGAGLEYKFSSKLGFWLKGGNLLGQQVRRSLFHVDKSPYVTLGVTLSL